MRFFFAILFFVTVTSPGIAEPPGAILEQPAADANSPLLEGRVFTRMVRNAGQIFSGTVLQVEHNDPHSANALSTTVIRFRVNEAIRGVQKGQVLEIKEWSGLWASGRERYRPGETVLLFLYPPSKLGLTSPIGRSVRLAIDSDGNVLINTPGRKVKAMELRRVITAIGRREME